MATVPQPYHRVQFSVHVGGKPVPIKLALKPDSTISDALVQLRNVWSADNSKQSILIPNELAVMDSEGFWLPSYSPVNCVLKVNDKVSVYKLNKRKKDIVQDDGSKKRKAQSDDDVAVSSPAAQATVAPPKKKAKQDKAESKPESKKIDTKVMANDVKSSNEDSKRKRKKEKKKEHEEKKAEHKKSAEKEHKKHEEKKVEHKKSAEKEHKKHEEKKVEHKKSAEKKHEQKHQPVQVVVTEPVTDNADQSDAADHKPKRPRKARQERREHKQHAEADRKVTLEPSSTETEVKTTTVDSLKEVQVTDTDDQSAELLASDAPSAGSIGDEESNGQTSSDEVENKKISQAADYLSKHAGLLDTIAGSTTDGTSATEEVETTPTPEAQKLTKKEQQALERKEKAAAKQEEMKRKKEERELEQAKKKAEKEAAQAKRKEEAQKKKEAGKQKKTKAPVEESADSSSVSTQEDNCKIEVSNKLVPSFMPSNRGPSLADIMKNSKDIIQKSIYGTASKKPSTSSTQPNSIVEKKPPTQASKDSDSDSNSDDEDNNGSALNHLTSWMNELQQPREKV